MNETLLASEEPREQQRDATERMRRPCEGNSSEPSPRVTGDTEDQTATSTLEIHTWPPREAGRTGGLSTTGQARGEGHEECVMAEEKERGGQLGGTCMVPHNWGKDRVTNLKQALQPDLDRPRASFGFWSLFSRPEPPVPDLIMSTLEIFL